MPRPDLLLKPKEVKVLLEASPRAKRAGRFRPRLLAHQSAFVILHRGDTLRGCVGSIEACRPLVDDVAPNAYAAAFEDPRFEAARR